MFLARMHSVRFGVDRCVPPRKLLLECFLASSFFKESSLDKESSLCKESPLFQESISKFRKYRGAARSFLSLERYRGAVEW